MVIQIHRVKQGETLESIAKRYGVTVDVVCEKNGLAKEQKPRPGQTLIIPIVSGGEGAAANSSTTENGNTPDIPSTERKVAGRVLVSEVYYVREGDTVESIAQKYGVPPDVIRAKNSLTGAEKLQPGQLLVIPVRESVVYQRESPPSQAAKASAREPSAGATQKSEGKMVGKLGVVTSNGARIRRSPSPGGRAVYTCSQGMQLVIVQQKNDWFGVMMIDGSTCWIPKKYVQNLDVELVAGKAEPGTPGAGNPSIVNEAYKYLGVPYVYGGSSWWGMDCSAFVRRVFQSRGISLPRTAAQQFHVGMPVGYEQLEPGDRLYFSSDGYRIDHTAIYIGNGRMIHASGRAGQVTIDNLFSSRYWSTFVGARR